MDDLGRSGPTGADDGPRVTGLRAEPLDPASLEHDVDGATGRADAAQAGDGAGDRMWMFVMDGWVYRVRCQRQGVAGSRMRTGRQGGWVTDTFASARSLLPPWGSMGQRVRS